MAAVSPASIRHRDTPPPSEWLGPALQETARGPACPQQPWVLGGRGPHAHLQVVGRDDGPAPRAPGVLLHLPRGLEAPPAAAPVLIQLLQQHLLRLQEAQLPVVTRAGQQGESERLERETAGRWEAWCLPGRRPSLEQPSRLRDRPRGRQDVSHWGAGGSLRASRLAHGQVGERLRPPPLRRWLSPHQNHLETSMKQILGPAHPALPRKASGA